MSQVLDPNNKSAGSERQNGPRHIGELINEYFQLSDSPLAKGYRKFLASAETISEKGDKKNE